MSGNEADVRISSMQVLAVLLIGRVIGAFTAAVAGGYRTDDLLGVLCGLPLLWLLGLPAVTLPGGLLAEADALSSRRRVGVRVFYAAFFFCQTALSAGRFDAFFRHVMPSVTGAAPVAALLLIPTAYAVCQGLEGLTRAGSLLAVVCLSALGLTVIALLPHGEAAHVTSPLLSQPQGVARATLSFVIRTPEAAAWGMLSPHLTGSPRRGYRRFCLAAAGACLTVTAVAMAVLGGFMTVTAYPFYTATEVFSLGAFQNLEALQIGVWTLGAFVKTALCLWLCRRCLLPLAPGLAAWWGTALLAAGAAAAALWLAAAPSALPPAVPAVLWVVGVCLLPAGLWISRLRKGAGA